MSRLRRSIRHNNNNCVRTGVVRLNLFRILLLPVLLACAVSARAELLIGLANVSNITGLNLEWAGDRSSYYVMPGLEMRRGGLREDNFRWVVGMRHRLERGLMSSSGFYSGLLAGNFGDSPTQVDRHGAGAELGHQWVKEYSRIGLGAALLYMEEVEELDLKGEPRVVLGINFSLRK